jgi:transcriptional regulator with XRE-family HTH domain
MKVKERLLECKITLGIKSDYALAEALGVSRQRVSELMKGRTRPDAFIAVQIGDILRIHPLMLVAEFEVENAKDADRKAFWINFGRRIKTGALAMLALISTAFWSPEPRAESSALIRIMLRYVKSRARGYITKWQNFGSDYIPFQNIENRLSRGALT